MLRGLRTLALLVASGSVACGSVDGIIVAEGSGTRPRVDGGSGAKPGAGGNPSAGGSATGGGAGGDGGDGGSGASGGRNPGGASGDGGSGGGEAGAGGSGGEEITGSGGAPVDSGAPGAGGLGAAGAGSEDGSWALCESDDDCTDGRSCATEGAALAGRPAACVRSCVFSTSTCDPPPPGGTVSCLFGTCALTCGTGTQCPPGLECLTGICYY